ncbi:MAG: hypothetical protein NC344_09790 [Bacteroidales bacterium]|nr:hypothetical protein [Bacteroidales bacterium]MCM1148095.1 hypothetical protein [Bacteroidales bacterium]MCM1509449.1 hypothetical protein [Clostridium sp.]
MTNKLKNQNKMNGFNINVHVKIDVEEQLFALLSAFSGGKAVSREAGQAASAQEAEAPSGVSERQPAPAAGTVAEEPSVQQAGEPSPAAGRAKEYTGADVRAAMDRARRRIEGEDYKENTAGEGYKKWHRLLTGEFKRIAALLGAEKPSMLPDSDSRAGFIRMCDELVAEGGAITTNAPF